MTYKKPESSQVIEQVKQFHHDYAKYVEEAEKSLTKVGYVASFFVSLTPTRGSYVENLNNMVVHLEKNWDNISELFEDLAGGMNSQKRKSFKQHVLLSPLFLGFISIENEYNRSWFKMDPQVRSKAYKSLQQILFPKIDESSDIDPSINKTSMDIDADILYSSFTAGKKYLQKMDEEAAQIENAPRFLDMIAEYDDCLKIVQKRLPAPEPAVPSTLCYA